MSQLAQPRQLHVHFAHHLCTQTSSLATERIIAAYISAGKQLLRDGSFQNDVATVMSPWVVLGPANAMRAHATKSEVDLLVLIAE